MTKEQLKLHADWHNVFGTDMPPHIERLPVAEIKKALEHGRERYQPVTELIGSDDSMMDHDGHNNY